MRLDHLLSKELWRAHVVRASRPMPRPFVSGVVLKGGTSTMAVLVSCLVVRRVSSGVRGEPGHGVGVVWHAVGS